MSTPLRIPLRVTVGTMLWAKVRSALRPSRLLLMAVAVGLLGVGLTPFTGQGMLETTATVFVLFTTGRALAMGLSSVLDRDARRFDGATLEVGSELRLLWADGTEEVLPEGWVIGVREQGDGFVLQASPRLGRTWLWVAGPTVQGPEARAALLALGD